MNLDLTESPLSQTLEKSPIFEFCKPRRSLVKTSSYSPQSPLSPKIPSRKPTLKGSKNPKNLERRRHSVMSINPLSPTIMMTQMSSNRPKLPSSALDESTSPTKDIVENLQFTTTEVEQSSRLTTVKTQTRETGSQHCSYSIKSHECLQMDIRRDSTRSNQGERVQNKKNVVRKSTSDLTEINDADTEVTLLSSPRRRGSMKGGLG